MDWNDLRFFLAARRAGTLAGAARELRVEHTTVGRRLAALEEALGSKLFTRASDGLRLTRAGEELLPLAEQAEASMQAIERRSGGDAQVAGKVRLSVSEALSGFFVKRLVKLRAQHPELVVDVIATNRAVDLLRGEADLAVRAIAGAPPAELICRKLVRAGWGLYASSSYLSERGRPKSATALAGHDLISFEESMSSVAGAAWLSEHGAGARVVLRANSLVAALNAAVAGFGICSIPCFMAGEEKALERISSQVIGERELLLLTHRDNAKVARIRAVADFVVQIFKSEKPLFSGL